MVDSTFITPQRIHFKEIHEYIQKSGEKADCKKAKNQLIEKVKTAMRTLTHIRVKSDK